MATPSLTRHEVPGALGPILVDVRAGGRASPRPAVVIVHGFKGFKDWGMFPPLAERLARAGMTAVSFNMSGSGVDDAGDFTLPERFGRNTYSAELADLDRVLSALAAGELGVPGPTGIGLVGHSRGGGIAILQAAGDERVQALVTWSAIATVDRWSEEAKAAWRRRGHVNIQNSRTGQVFPLRTDVLDDLEQHGEGSLNILKAAAAIGMPWLIVHGARDETVDLADAEALKAASGRDSTQLVVIAGAGHTFYAVHPWQGAGPEVAEAFDTTAAFLSRHLAS
jgi:dienelactone hydrolase